MMWLEDILRHTVCNMKETCAYPGLVTLVNGDWNWAICQRVYISPAARIY